jgi:hypothetical protein
LPDSNPINRPGLGRERTQFNTFFRFFFFRRLTPYFISIKK